MFTIFQPSFTRFLEITTPSSFFRCDFWGFGRVFRLIEKSPLGKGLGGEGKEKAQVECPGTFLLRQEGDARPWWPG
jgi:hypothetical protein